MIFTIRQQQYILLALKHRVRDLKHLDDEGVHLNVDDIIREHEQLIKLIEKE